MPLCKNQNLIQVKTGKKGNPSKTNYDKIISPFLIFLTSAVSSYVIVLHDDVTHKVVTHKICSMHGYETSDLCTAVSFISTSDYTRPIRAQFSDNSQLSTDQPIAQNTTPLMKLSVYPHNLEFTQRAFSIPAFIISQQGLITPQSFQLSHSQTIKKEGVGGRGRKKKRISEISKPVPLSINRYLILSKGSDMHGSPKYPTLSKQRRSSTQILLRQSTVPIRQPHSPLRRRS